MSRNSLRLDRVLFFLYNAVWRKDRHQNSYWLLTLSSHVDLGNFQPTSMKVLACIWTCTYIHSAIQIISLERWVRPCCCNCHIFQALFYILCVRMRKKADITLYKQVYSNQLGRRETLTALNIPGLCVPGLFMCSRTMQVTCKNTILIPNNVLWVFLICFVLFQISDILTNKVIKNSHMYQLESTFPCYIKALNGFPNVQKVMDYCVLLHFYACSLGSYKEN